VGGLFIAAILAVLPAAASGHFQLAAGFVAVSAFYSLYYFIYMARLNRRARKGKLRLVRWMIFDALFLGVMVISPVAGGIVFFKQGMQAHFDQWSAYISVALAFACILVSLLVPYLTKRGLRPLVGRQKMPASARIASGVGAMSFVIIRAYHVFVKPRISLDVDPLMISLGGFYLLVAIYFFHMLAVHILQRFYFLPSAYQGKTGLKSRCLF
jgi:NO-binding membrane sensor protein with MHYT domain